MSVTRRRRRERQIIVFGILVIALVALAIASAAVVRGDARGPFSAAFHTPAGDFKANTTLVCPPNSNPIPYDQVVVRVNNGTEESGLAGSTASALEARGFLVTGVANWALPFADFVQIHFGADGIAQGYTLATQFESSGELKVELVLDTREGPTVDLILGEKYIDNQGLRDALAPELDMDLPLSAGADCLPVNVLIDKARPAPKTLPENPLAEANPESSAAPDQEADAE